MKKKIPLVRPTLFFVGLNLVLILIAYIILKIPNPQDPLKMIESPPNLLFHKLTFLYFWFFIFVLWGISKLEENFCLQSFYNKYAVLFRLIPIPICLMILLLIFQFTAVINDMKLLETGYLHRVVPIILVFLFLVQIGFQYYSSSLTKLMLNKVREDTCEDSVEDQKKGTKDKEWGSLDLMYKNSLSEISLSAFVLIVFCKRKSLFVTKRGRLKFKNKFPRREFFKVLGSEEFEFINNNTLVRKEWIEGVTEGKDKYVRLIAERQKQVDKLIKEGDKYQNEAYDTDYLRKKKLKANAAFIKKWKNCFTQPSNSE